MGNVLQIMNYAAPYRGNFIESIETIGRHLEKHNRENIYIFYNRADNAGAHEWIDPLVLQGRKIYFLSGNIVNDSLLIRKIIKRHHVDTLHIHFEAVKTDISAYLATRFLKIKRIRHFHSHYKTQNTAKRLFKKILYKDCILVGVSREVTGNVASNFNKNRIVTIENAAYFPRLDDVGEIEMVDDIRCMVFGYNYFIKGIDLAIKAIELARKKHPIHLYIPVAGKGEATRAEIIKHWGSVPDWVTLLPPRNDIATYYHMADIFLSSSRIEGFSYALLEAAYCKCIIVASNIPAERDLKVPHIFWFESENTQDLHDKLLEAIEKRSNFSAELDEARQAVVKNYSIDKWAEEIIALY